MGHLEDTQRRVYAGCSGSTKGFLRAHLGGVSWEESQQVGQLG